MIFRVSKTHAIEPRVEPNHTGPRPRLNAFVHQGCASSATKGNAWRWAVHQPRNKHLRRPISSGCGRVARYRDWSRQIPGATKTIYRPKPVASAYSSGTQQIEQSKGMILANIDAIVRQHAPFSAGNMTFWSRQTNAG